MYWLKRHFVWILLLVGGIVVIVFTAGFRSGKVKKMTVADKNLEEVVSGIKRILMPPQSSVDDYTGQDLRPTDENIQAARMIRDNTQVLVDKADKKVMIEHPVPLYERADAFRVELEKMISELNELAEDRRVELPSTNGSYKFSFINLVGKTSISRDKLVPLSYQMSDVRTIFDILARSRIKKLDSLKRVPVAPDDYQALKKQRANHFLIRPYSKYTNAVAVVTPYAVTFTTLSRAVPKVIGEFAGYDKGLFIVRKVVVMTEEDSKTQGSRMGGNNDASGTPFGPGGEPGGLPSSPFATTPRPTQSLPGRGVPGGASMAVTVLDEKVLWVELYLDVYRPIKQPELADPNAPANPAAAPGAR